MAHSPGQPVFILGFFAGFMLLGIFISLSGIAYSKVKSQDNGCDPSECVSEDGIYRQCLKDECVETLVTPNMCTSLEECFQCDPFGNNGVGWYLDTLYTDLVSNSNCTGNVYIQDSVTNNGNLLVQCFSTFPDSPCESTFGEMTVDSTMFVNYVQTYNRSFVNLNNLLVYSNYTQFNVTGPSSAAIANLDVDDTLFVNYINSCFNQTINFNGVLFYPNGTLRIPTATITSLDISSINELIVQNSVIVQGILISDGTVQGFNGNQPSNVIVNPVSQGVGFGFADMEYVLNSEVVVNGTLAVDSFTFWPNNCTSSEQSNCLWDYFYSWTGYTNVTGLPGYTSLNIKMQRHNDMVFMRIQNVTSNYTSPQQISATLSNTTSTVTTGSTPFNSSNWIPTKKINSEINVYFPSLNTSMYGIVSLDPQGNLKIFFDPYYTLTTVQFYWNTLLVSWSMFNQ
jgi:hypothetical protein